MEIITIWERIINSIGECKNTNIQMFKLDDQHVKRFLGCNLSLCDYFLCVGENEKTFIFLEHSDLISKFKSLELAEQDFKKVKKAIRKVQGVPNDIKNHVISTLDDIFKESIHKEARLKLSGSLIAIKLMGLNWVENFKIVLVLCYNIPEEIKIDIHAFEYHISKLEKNLRNEICASEVRIHSEHKITKWLKRKQCELK